MENEQNPIGVRLMQIDDGDVALFIGLKFAGTIIVLGHFVLFFFWKNSLAWTLIIPVCIFQLFLLLYLVTDIYRVFT